MHKYVILNTFILLFATGCFAQSDRSELFRHVDSYHQSFVSIDSHSDTPMWFLSEGYDFGERHHPGKTSNKIDLPRMDEGGLDAVFLAAFVGQRNRTPENYDAAYHKAHQIIDSIETVATRHADKATIALTPEEAKRLKGEGKKALFIGLENGFPIAKDLTRVEEFYKRGVRYITLAHTDNNDICDSSTDTTEHNGLSSFGEKVVREMNRLGIMVDVSHISDSAFYDVLTVSPVPVIASHSNARAIRNHPRNLSDEMLHAIAKNGGVVQVCVLSDYVKEMPRNPERDSAMTALRERFHHFKNLTPEEEAKARTAWRNINRNFPPNKAHVNDLVDHIDHIVEVAGIDHVGIGTDFDGGGALRGVNDVSELKNITAELIRRGYSREEIEKIWGANFFRVFNRVIDHAESIKKAS